MARAAQRIDDPRMAFDLPRNPRSLRFTDEVRSLAADKPMRPRLPSSGVDTPTRTRTARGALPSLDGEDDDDDGETLCMDRDRLDAAVLPKQQHVAVEAPPGPQLSVPGFRSREDVIRQEQAAVYAPKQARVDGPFPLGVWLIASLVLAVVSFFAAPIARVTLRDALHVSADR